MKRLAILLALALLLALPASALADVSRGDRGEEVRYLQWLLFNAGWLFEEPDGIFGGHTEEAVKNYQQSKGYEPTGTATAELMREIDEDRVRLDREHYGRDYYEPYPGNFTPPYAADDTTSALAPAHCQATMLRGIGYRDYCEDHLAILEQEANLTLSGEASAFAEAGDLWLEAIGAEFTDWINAASPEDRLDVLAAWTAWNAYIASQRNALYATWNDAPVVEQQMALIQREIAAMLCEVRSGEALAASSMDYLAADGDVQRDAFCMSWSIATGSEFVTGCDTHAPLIDREYEWNYAGATDEAELEEIVAGWSQALLSLNEQWAARGGNAEGIANAQSALFSALSLQSAALAPVGGNADALGRLRMLQFECARMCELLNGIKPN